MAVRDDQKTPGELLQEARQARDMSIDGLADITKIPAEMLRAIELDEYQQISGPLYIRSFLRAFADGVGADAGMVLGRYEEKYGRPPAVDNAGAVWSEDEVEVKKITGDARLLVRGLAIALVVVVIGFGAWRIMFRDGESADSSAASGTGVETGVSEAGAPDTPPGSDSLAGSWLESSTEVATPPATTPSAGISPSGDTAPPAEAAVPERIPDTPELPNAAAGVPTLRFAGGKEFPLVLRVICPFERTINLRRDGAAAPQSVQWTAARYISPLPAQDVVPGRPYAVREGYVVYWGADDNIYLQLGAVDGVEIRLNGVAQAVSDYRFGGEILLNRDSLDP